MVTKEIIAEITGLPTSGPIWTIKKERLQKVIEIFQDEGQNLTMKGKGVLPATLGEPWSELAKVVQSYITCEGRKDVVRPRHLKLLAVLKGKCSVNLPALLNSLLHDASRSLKKAHHEDAVVSHHGLIRLIVSHSLTQQQSSWGELITTIGGGVASPSPKAKHPASTSETPKKPRESPKPKHPSDTPEQPKKRTESVKQKRKRSSRASGHAEKRKKLATEERAASKRRHSSGMPEQSEKRRKVVVEEQVASTPEQPERPRKSARLARIRGRLEKIQLSNDQPIEITDEPPVPDQEPLRENMEQVENEAEAEEGNEHSDFEAEADYPEAATEQPIQEEEMEQLGDSPSRDPVEEEELATILASLGEYASPSSPPDPPEGPSGEETHEELHEEMAGEENPPVVDKENVSNNREQSVPKTPEENPPAVDVENENVNREQFVPRMPEETLDERGPELRATHAPTAEAREIKKLRKKQQRLLNIIAQLRQKIRSLKTSLRIRRTIRRKRRTNAAGSCRMRRKGAYRRPVGQCSTDKPTTVPTSTEEQHAVPSDMEHQNVVLINDEE